MSSQPRITVSEPARLEVVPSRRKNQRSPMRNRIISTLVAVVILVLVMRYLPPTARPAKTNQMTMIAAVTPSDLQFSDVQISQGSKDDGLYLDGMVTNRGKAPVSAAQVQVDFRDAQGKLIASVQTPLAGMAHGTADLLPREFARNPIVPNAMRVFRVEVQPVP